MASSRAVGEGDALSDEAPRAGRSRRHDQIRRRQDAQPRIGGERRREGCGIADLGQIGELMDDDIGPGRHDSGADGITVIGIEDHGRCAGCFDLARLLDRPGRSRDSMARGDEEPGQRPADGAGSPGEKDAHGSCSVGDAGTSLSGEGSVPHQRE
jgi:hypothetical protein